MEAFPGQRLRAQLDELLDTIERDVSRARNDRRLAFNFLISGLQHFAHKIDRAVAGRFRPAHASAEGKTFTSHCSSEGVRQSAILPEEVADLARANADVSRRDIPVRSDVAVQFRHERLTKAHHFAIAFILRIKIGTALRTALRTVHRQAGQAVFKDLLKAEKLQHAFGNSRVRSGAPESIRLGSLCDRRQRVGYRRQPLERHREIPTGRDCASLSRT